METISLFYANTFQTHVGKMIESLRGFIGTNQVMAMPKRDLAVEHYTNALEMAEQFSPLFEKSEPTRHLAWNAFWKGDLDQALISAKLALSLREAANFRPHLPFNHLLLSDIYLKKGDRTNAVFHICRFYAGGPEENSANCMELISVFRWQRRQALCARPFLLPFQMKRSSSLTNLCKAGWLVAHSWHERASQADVRKVSDPCLIRRG